MKRSVRRRRIAAYLTGAGPKYLKIGAWNHTDPGWLATDINPKFPGVVYLDATKPWPVPARSFDAVDCEHVIEHVTYESGLNLLRECRRALKQGGVLRVSTPRMELIPELLSGAESRYAEWSNCTFGEGGEGANPCFTINRMVREWGHTFIYDEATLTEAMHIAGFDDVVKCRPGESAHAALIGIDRHAEEVGEENNRSESLILEAS